MPAETIISTEYGSLLYHPEHNIVHHIFHQPIGGEAFRSILTAGVELLRQHSAEKWLSDDRSNSALSEEDTQWGIDTWVPTAVEAGWRYWALVVPTDLYGRMNMKEHVDFYSRYVRIMVFTDPDEALTWLIAQ